MDKVEGMIGVGLGIYGGSGRARGVRVRERMDVPDGFAFSGFAVDWST